MNEDLFQQEMLNILKEVKTELLAVKAHLTVTPTIAQPSTTSGGGSKSRGGSRKPKETQMTAVATVTEVVAEADVPMPIVVLEPPTVVPDPPTPMTTLLSTWTQLGMVVPIASALPRIKTIVATNVDAGMLALVYGLGIEHPDMDELSKALTQFFATKYRVLALALFEQRQKGTFVLKDALMEWEREAGQTLAQA